MSTQVIKSRDGASIVFDIVGQGPDLMLLHGAGKTRRDWKKTGYIDRVKADYRVINVDIRGSGDSEFLTHVDDYTIENIYFDLEEVAASCNVQQMMVLGYSFGGTIARYLGAWSERVKAIAIIGVPFGPAVHPEFDAYIDEFVEKYGALADVSQTGKLSEQQRKSAIKGRIPALIACFQAMRSWPAIEVADLKCPALMVTGTKNQSVLNWINDNHEKFGNGQLKVETIDGLTHQQEFSQIDRVYPIVKSFFENIDRKPEHVEEPG